MSEKRTCHQIDGKCVFVLVGFVHAISCLLTCKALIFKLFYQFVA